MSEAYELIYDFQNLYAAHRVARSGKKNNAEVIRFEMRLAENLCNLQDELKQGTWHHKNYRHFMIFEPKERSIYAPSYADRVVQHSLCDNIVSPIFEKRLIYDNAACRVGKGTHFALNRLSGFLRKHYRTHGEQGWFLKCDIKKYFDNIDHGILKERLQRIFRDKDILTLLYKIIDSYESFKGKGLPLGNQTSQWFALYYLDGLDRFIKEKLRIRGYIRYMDDSVLIHHDREYINECLFRIREILERDLKLNFNDKTQIAPIANGIKFLGFHCYLTENGKVVRKVSAATKKRFKRRMRKITGLYSDNRISAADVNACVAGHIGHLRHGNTYRLRCAVMKNVILQHSDDKLL